MLPQESSRASLARLLTFVFGALLFVIVPAVAGAQEDDDDDTEQNEDFGAGQDPDDTQPGDTEYPTTSTNVLVTSPPPTVAPPTTVAAQQVGRRWPVEVPAGCDAPALPDVVFVGTVIASDFQTGRFRVDQLRAGSIDGLSYQGIIDVRYGIDAKYLTVGSQYLVAASIDDTTQVLTSRITEPAPLFGGDEVIGQTESDVECPVLADPVRTLLTNGLPVDSGLLRPLREARTDVLRAILLPLGLAVAIVFCVVLVRWILTGLGWGIGTIFQRSRETPAIRRLHRTETHSSQPR